MLGATRPNTPGVSLFDGGRKRCEEAVPIRDAPAGAEEIRPRSTSSLKLLLRSTQGARCAQGASLLVLHVYFGRFLKHFLMEASYILVAPNLIWSL